MTQLLIDLVDDNSLIVDPQGLELIYRKLVEFDLVNHPEISAPAVLHDGPHLIIL